MAEKCFLGHELYKITPTDKWGKEWEGKMVCMVCMKKLVGNYYSPVLWMFDKLYNSGVIGCGHYHFGPETE